MEKLFRIFVLLLLCTCCERLQPPFGARVRGDRTSITGPFRQRDSTGSGDGVSGADTVVRICAVRVPDDYDWAKDSASGRFEGELILYRGADPELIVPVRPESVISPSPGTHHIIGGHLYTERCCDGRTYICRDGKLLVHFDGSAILKGLLCDSDGALISLSCSPGDGSIVLRRDSEVLLPISHGSVIGGFGEGRDALYEDDGHICFAYTDSGNLFSVRDAVISAVMAPETDGRAEDVLWLGGRQTVLWRKNGTEHILSRSGLNKSISGVSASLSLVPLGEALFVRGEASFGMGLKSVYINTETLEYSYFRVRNGWPYSIGGKLYLVSGADPLGVFARGAKSYEPLTCFSDPSLLAFSGECAAVLGNGLLIGASAPGGPPLLLHGGRAAGEFPFNGYVTAVDVEIIPPS